MCVLERKQRKMRLVGEKSGPEHTEESRVIFVERSPGKSLNDAHDVNGGKVNEGQSFAGRVLGS